jgi:signal transduction histidine kinase/ligand-binding sensor domain-containing protein
MGKPQARTIVCLALLLACSACAFALDPSLDVSQYAHTAWTVRDGFIKGPIHSIAQTPDGYLWLGTEFGLLRFDGVRAGPWEPPAGEHLPGNVVMELLVSRDGTLWIGAGKGLASWKDGRLTQYPELAGWIVAALLEDHEGTLWAGGFGFAEHGRLCALKDGRSQCDDPGGVLKLYEDRKNALWVSTWNGLWRWKPQTPEFFSTGKTFTSALIEDDTGLLVGGVNGIQRFVNGKTEAYPVGTVARQFGVNSFLWDHDGGFWIGTFAGLAHWHRGRADFFRQVDGLSANAVHSVFEDREGNIWVATDGGLDRFRDFAVSTFSSKEAFPPGLYGPILAAKDGSLWFSTSDRLSQWKNPEIEAHDHPSPANHVGVVTDVREIHDSGLRGQVRGLFQDSGGRLWVIMLGGFGYINNGKFVLVKAAPGGTRGSIAEGADGDLWFSFDNALFHLVDGTFAEEIPWDRLGIKDGGGRIAVDPLQGGLWIGLPHRGIAFLKHGLVERWYTTADGLGEGQISHLRVDREGALWASTEGGLSLIKDGHVATLSRKNGFPCDAVHWSEEDAGHSVWLHLECGLARVSASEVSAWVADRNGTVRVTLLDNSDGVAAKSVIFGDLSSPVTKSSDGKLWFNVENGISVVDPHHLPFNKLPPPVHIEQITADRKTYWENWAGDASSPPSLPPLVRDLTIDYTALSLVIPEKVLFRYKLEGWDRDWQDVSNRRQAFYTNLPPRHYRFRVVACNNSAVWNEAGTFLDFSIAPAYWQTNWFRTLCVLAFVAILWAAHRLRFRVLEERQALLERHQAVLEQHQGEIRALNERLMKAQEEERVRIAGELHDGVLQKLTSLALELRTATLALPTDSEPKAEVRQVEKKLIEVGAEIRQLSHELHPAVLQEAGLPAALSSYCEEFSKLRGVPIDYQVAESVEELSPGAALCIYRIAQEALGNVAKHAQAKQVQVRLTRSDSRVRLVVSDDGVGFNPDGSGKSGGLGLINMRERVHQLNGTFEFDSKPGHGTTVKAEVPFRPAS